MSNYFEYFPTLVYANTAAINVIAKVKFEESVARRSALFYEYQVEEGERADQIADHYYEDPSYDWVVYLSNGIIDPLNEWYKTENEMSDFLSLKYGSVTNAKQQTAYYQVSYMFDDSVISPAAYDSLSTGQKQYWAPILGYNDTVINYQRKVMDTIAETNRVIALNGSFGSIPVGSVIKQSGSVNGTVGYANSSNVVLKHVNGEWATSTPVYYSSTGGVANATITSVTNINQSIPSDEFAYWAPVSLYDYESELNERRKHIRLMNSAYLELIERDMRDLL